MWRSLISLPTTVIVILSGILGNLVQLLTLFVPSRPLSYRINSWIACSIWWMLHHLLFTINSDNKLEIVEDGDAIPKGESALVISNHVSAGDWFLINAVAHRKDMLGNARYFLKDSIKYLPFFGWGMWLMGMVFLKRSWASDKNGFSKSLGMFTKHDCPVWLVSFVEGNRFCPEKLLQTRMYCAKNGTDCPKNTLLPRTKGFVACVEELKSCNNVSHVYDFTIAFYHPECGFNVAPGIGKVALGLVFGYTFFVRVKRWSISSIPTQDEQCSEWLKQRFIEKDAYLELLRQACKKKNA